MNGARVEVFALNLLDPEIRWNWGALNSLGPQGFAARQQQGCHKRDQGNRGLDSLHGEIF